MPVASHLQLILPLLLLIGCITEYGEGNASRHRRQVPGGNNYNIGQSPRNSDGLISSNNVQFNPSNSANIPGSNNQNNRQQSNNNLLPSSQGQAQPIRARSFYDSSAFKPPSFSGQKPVGWFDTKYPNWISNQDSQSDQNTMVDGKNAPPSSLQGKVFQPRRDDGGPVFLQKVAKYYSNRGEKAFNFGQHNRQRGRGSVCINLQNFDGYTFGKFPCPLPPVTGMNQLDQHCCGPANNQYCCNEQEFNQYQTGGYGRHRHSKSYLPSKNRTLAIVLPIIGIIVAAGAGIVVFLYYKKLRNDQHNDRKLTVLPRLSDNYSAVPQDLPAEKPTVTPRQQQKTNVQA